jgi:hypothetical protein
MSAVGSKTNVEAQTGHFRQLPGADVVQVRFCKQADRPFQNDGSAGPRGHQLYPRRHPDYQHAKAEGAVARML